MVGRLLVLGSSGQVAQEMPVAARTQGFDDVIMIGRETADLVIADAAQILAKYTPDVVVNAAAYTAVDKAETERDKAFGINATMPGRFATAAASISIPFVHISTDYVFDGSKSEPYVEDDLRAPLGVYGESKAAGEDAVCNAGGNAAIMRTAWVYGPRGSNFMKTIMRLGETRTELSVVSDQIGCPTRSCDVAEGAARLARALLDDQLKGTVLFHCAGGGETSWAGFAEAIFQEQASRGLPTPVVKPIPSSEYPTIACRPANSRLDSRKLEASIGWRAPDWRHGLAEVFKSGVHSL